jgi:hypothetical protein
MFVAQQENADIMSWLTEHDVDVRQLDQVRQRFYSSLLFFIHVVATHIEQGFNACSSGRAH